MLHVMVAGASGTITDLCATDHVRLPGVSLIANSEEGTVATSQLLVDDLSGALDIVGLRRVWAYEDTAPAGNQIIWTGYIGDREYGRRAGGEDEFVVGADRRISTALVESNALLSRRLITGADGDRPAETDLQRIAWLLSSSYLTGVASTYVATSGGVNMGAGDLRGLSAYEVLSACANASNRNFNLVLVDGGSPSTGAYTYALFYDYDYAAVLDSTLRLCNTRSEIDNTTTFALNPEALLRRTPERVYSGVLNRYNGGAVYTQNTTTGDTYGYRDTTKDSPLVSDSAVATSQNDRYLADMAHEEDRITAEFTVPAASVNLLREGYRVQLKASHFPGYSSDYQYMRCLRREVTQQSDDYYRIGVTLAPLGVTTYSEAQLQSPQSSQFGGGSGAFRVQWDNDGDSPGSGCSSLARHDLLAYRGVAAERTGVTVNGDGLLTITNHGTLSGVGGGDITMIAYIYRNGAVVASDTQSTSGGLRALSWTWNIVATNVAVRKGDYLEAYFYISAAPNILVIPAGTGDCANMFYVRGYLRA